MDNAPLLGELEKLRELLHKSASIKPGIWQEPDKDRWNKLWTAFDSVVDTQLAINEFAESSSTRLGTYGLLQAMAVQQDSVMHMKEALGLPTKKLDDLPKLKEIRDIRDETIGHPTKTKHKQTASNTYTSLSAAERDKTKLKYIVWGASRSEIKEVNFQEAMADQSRELVKELKEITEKVTEIENAHRKKFKGQSLEATLAQSHYYISKLYSFEHTREYSKSCLNSLIKEYDAFKKALRERYGPKVLDDAADLPGITVETDKLDKILPRIRDRIMLQENIDHLELDVYVEAADHAFKDLRQCAKEIDEEFS